MARSFRSSLKRSVAAGAALVMLSGAIATPSVSWAQSPARPAAPSLAPVPGAGPASVADLAEGLLDAVVNISTSQSVKNDGDGPQKPVVPEGSPFQEFFNDFFDGDGKGEGNRKVNSLGSGFVIDPAGFVVTNNHVIEGADDIEVIFPNGDKLKARLIGTDTKTDLSVLKVEPKAPLKAVRFGDSRRMRIGDWVMAIGNPFGLGGSVTLGIISARGRNINAGPYDNFIQTDASINKGNSGGPLFNTRGEVIGINTAIISPSGGSIGIGFAVPTELAENIVKQLIEFGETRRGWLGVRIQPVTDDVSTSLGLKAARGALVSGVIKGGPVDNGSIRAGDVILTFDGKPVKEMRDLPLAVAESPVGKEVDVVVMRDGKEQTVKVTLGQLENSAEPEQDAGQPVLPESESEDMEPDDDTDQSQAPEIKPPAAAGDSVSPAGLGLALSSLGEEQRRSFGIGAGVNGVVITAVEPNTAAAEKGLKTGEVIVEVGQDAVKNPDDVTKRVQSLKSEGRRFAHMMVSDAKGELRIVAVPLE
ncbi:Do family serine endopeptidase [Neorhizobium sp. NPDC001467]|uniref:Do family serine endopeptidase n=1 Tax=Neorhizobium sp. NPDC001467 TaxID=3390595 RepID=UPI003CFD1E11